MVLPLGPHLRGPPRPSKQECRAGGTRGRHSSPPTPPPLGPSLPGPGKLALPSLQHLRKGSQAPGDAGSRFDGPQAVPPSVRPRGPCSRRNHPALRPLDYSLLAVTPQAGRPTTAAWPPVQSQGPPRVPERSRGFSACPGSSSAPKEDGLALPWAPSPQRKTTGSRQQQGVK